MTAPVPLSRDDRLLAHLEELAKDVGRLRRRVARNENELDEWMVDGIARRVLDLVAMLEPNAATIARCTAPGCEQAISEAIVFVDKRDHQWERLLGFKEAA